jgi:hypothetical protein
MTATLNDKIVWKIVSSFAVCIKPSTTKLVFAISLLSKNNKDRMNNNHNNVSKCSNMSDSTLLFQ